MSALTKIFVVLLVILSLVLSSAVIVFVNTQTVTAKALADQKTESGKLKQERDQANAQLNLNQMQTQSQLATKDAQINQDHNDLAAVQQLQAKAEAQNAELTAQLASMTVTQTNLSDGLKAAQTSIAERTKSYDDLRNNYDKQVAQVVGLNLRIDELTNTSDVRGRSLMVANEQIAQLQQDISKQSDVLRRYNLSPTSDASGVINPDPGINITARIEKTRDIDRARYATINVGATDGIAKNMQLNVVDPVRHQWLGYIVVDTVDAHSATGRITGPNVGQVQQGAEVKSRL